MLKQHGASFDRQVKSLHQRSMSGPVLQNENGVEKTSTKAEVDARHKEQSTGGRHLEHWA